MKKKIAFWPKQTITYTTFEMLNVLEMFLGLSGVYFDLFRFAKAFMFALHSLNEWMN